MKEIAPDALPSGLDGHSPVAQPARDDAIREPGHGAGAGLRDASGSLVSRLQVALAQAGVDAAHTLLLLPYAQLVPVMRAAWLAAVPTGFAPRMETTASWARTVPAASATALDISTDRSRDMLTARGLLEDAGLRDEQDALAPMLVDAAWQLLRAGCAIAPDQRPLWGERARAVIEPPALAQLSWEAAVARIALEWALASQCATDALFAPAAVPFGMRALAVVAGLQTDALSDSLCHVWQERGLPVLRLSLFADGDAAGAHGSDATPESSSAAFAFAPGAISVLRPDAARPVLLHTCTDAEDEAARAAACVLGHVKAGARPVALLAIDRALTRRISALVRARGAAIADETGWTLSTTRAAAQLMSALQACRSQASGDAVLDWAKEMPACAAAEVRQLEAALRRDGVRAWRDWRVCAAVAAEAGSRGGPTCKAQAPEAGVEATVQRIEAWRALLRTTRPLARWLEALATLLAQTGQWQELQADAAGRQVCASLWLDAPMRESLEASMAGTRWENRRLDLSAFITWVRDALESQSFRPQPQAHEGMPDVVVVPMAQLAGRPFAAVVIPGCDEQRLPPSPDPVGAWTPAQREALGLPSRAQLQLELAAAWRAVLRVPLVDILWRESDAAGESLQASPLVQALRAAAHEDEATLAEDPRSLRPVMAQRGAPPLPRAAALALSRLSASAYEDLRKCPYRFFALRQLGLREADELEADIDKRDFGLWLHNVLRRFHAEEAAAAPAPERQPDERRLHLDRCAAAASEELGLAGDEFLPFSATWPATRDGYLGWLSTHEAEGFAFDTAETWRRQGLGSLDLVGQIDRIDILVGSAADAPAGAQAADARVLVIDYKTESLDVTKKRVAQAGEDTQLAFYAALLPHDTLRAAYVNVGERGETRTVEQHDVVEERDRLLAGIRRDLRRMGAGAPLPALGEGAVCETCAVRGLCRKDFWSI